MTITMRLSAKQRRLVAVFGFTALFFQPACGRKKAETPTPSSSSSVASGATATASSPSPAKPFQLPAIAKKQAKYFPEGSPTRAIQDLDDTLESYIVTPKTPEDKQYNVDLKAYVIHGTFDVRELCKLSLDKHWNERTPQEQDAFVNLMTELLERKAIFSKEQGEKPREGGRKKTSYSITYEGDKMLNPEKSQALVMSTIHVPSESMKIGLNYKLRKEKDHWMIYDIIVDGASLLDNYKYQFDKIIDKDGYATLIHRMEAKLKDLEEKGGKDN